MKKQVEDKVKWNVEQEAGMWKIYVDGEQIGQYDISSDSFNFFNNEVSFDLILEIKETVRGLY